MLIAAAVATLLVPTLMTLGRNHWTTEGGAHGPLILISGLWLVWRERKHIHFRPEAISNWWLVLLAPLLLAYAYARSVSMLGIETASLYLTMVLLGFFYWGPRVMRRLWFPVIYLGFLIHPPYALVAEWTQPLKIYISQASVDLLHLFGYPIAASGVLIQVGQYELLVKQACAGLGSLVTLMALGLLYVHLTQPSDRIRTLILLSAIVPIAIFANFLRVIILILLTYHVSDGVAQSFAHDIAGVATFALSCLGMFAVDYLLTRLREVTQP